VNQPAELRDLDAPQLREMVQSLMDQVEADKVEIRERPVGPP